MKGVNLTMKYCQNFSICHNVPQYNNKIIKREEKWYKNEKILQETYLQYILKYIYTCIYTNI
jgi:hypothetical protein